MSVLGARVNPVAIDRAIAILESWIATRQRGRYVIVTGMHGIIEGYRDPTFRAILNGASLFVPDGYSLVWLARRRGFALKGRVCGADLLTTFCATAAQKGYRVFFYGDTEAVLARLQAQLRQDYPMLQIVGVYSPPYRYLIPAEDDNIVRLINGTRPDILWVGLGLPKQERWIADHVGRLDVPAVVAVGAAFKFVSRMVPRAPHWVGEHGLEWLWRFAHEPRRLWRRALIDVPQFTCLALLELSGFLKMPQRPDRTRGST
jgi:N-acetylglucosaminyldiphosphoundecaprenol N-acetyl-beta-D-mannosaminyltransferase